MQRLALTIFVLLILALAALEAMALRVAPAAGPIVARHGAPVTLLR
jgi:hypothetical protein